ncbi:hypothetical protein [Alkalicoccobacillus murimartini]|uniref:Flagellar hook-length control protein-like C-terminal domain-containing protein n=1 Tax=Alkalicoccobacillus murimartini TaxID=171685 RepID=A0ABT9YDR7_9BACI|nr:hypothetical protein [Alkalicoccobacillus murimartini]MDQ0205635.1 hypothetical protein [Alkalicoccobacillus murimartini]
MQISQLLSGNNVQPERQVKKGEIIRGATIEPISNFEAKVTYKGKEMKVTVDGQMPKSGAVSLQVTESGENGIRVREWTSEDRKQKPAQIDPSVELAQKAGIKRPSPLLVQAIKVAEANGQAVSSESIQALDRFIGSSNDPSKLNTLRALLSKQLPITDSHIKAVHETLHGKPLNQVLTELDKQLTTQPERSQSTLSKDQVLKLINQLTEGKELKGPEKRFIDNVRDRVIEGALTGKYEQLLTLVKETISGKTGPDITAPQNRPTIEKHPEEPMNQRPAGATQPKDQLQAVLLQLSQFVQTEGNPQKAVEAIQTTLQSNKDLPAEQVHRMNVEISKAVEKIHSGRELAARQILSTSIENEVNRLSQEEAQLVMPAVSSSVQPSSQQQSSKQIAVTTVTEKMASLTTEFREFQREASRTLRQLAIDLTPTRPVDTHQTKNQLDSIIRKLDHSILRGELMQFADMKTEKSLMMASSKLGEAKQLLESGQAQKAAQMVSQVQKQVDQLVFKPSETKVVFATNQSQLDLSSKLATQASPLQLFEEAGLKAQEGTARGVFDMVRKMGMNHETEVAQQLTRLDTSKDPQVSERNIKQSLLQLVQQHEEGSRASQLANQALNNVTGQQLLSKQDAQPIQSLFFQLPLVLEQKVEQLQCFIQSKKEGEQVDWQNCSLYFLMETKKMGDIGISVRVAQRQLSVTLKNDQEDFKLKMEPLVSKAIAKVEDIGYTISGISFAPFSDNKEQEPVPSTAKPVYTSEKGFDFKI